MNKKLISTFFSFLLIFSIATPIVISYLNLSVESIWYCDFSEEEKKEKSEIDVYENNFFETKQEYTFPIVWIEKTKFKDSYYNINKAFPSKIVLPPPESFI